MDKIIPSFSTSLFDGSKDSIGDIVEIGIDSLLDDGLFKDIPIVNMLVGVKNTYQNIHDRNLLKQTLAFIKQFNSGTIDQNKLIKYKELINSDSKKAEKELGRVLIILNSTVDMEKSQMLANLYKAYINEKINWNQFCEFSEIIKMLFLNDFNIIKLIYNHQVTDTSGIEIYPIDRLSSLGIVNTAMKSIMISNSANSRSDKYVNLTSIGEKFYESVINS